MIGRFIVDRVVLFRPHGGLNEVLGVINHAWRFAETTRQNLVVDASRSGFAHDFGRWFTPKWSTVPVSLSVSRAGRGTSREQ